MSRYVVAAQARRDILDIIAFIAADNPVAASRLRERLAVAFGQLADQPLLGHVRDDLVSRSLGVRFWPVGTYLVVYRVRSPSIEVARVLSGRRDISAVLNRGR